MEEKEIFKLRNEPLFTITTEDNGNIVVWLNYPDGSKQKYTEFDGIDRFDYCDGAKFRYSCNHLAEIITDILSISFRGDRTVDSIKFSSGKIKEINIGLDGEPNIVYRKENKNGNL